jgi:hypothetical protein
MEPDNTVRQAYRTAFGEYARKLDALQRLLDSGSPDGEKLERLIGEVENARLSHNSARDILAAELLAETAGGTPSRDTATTQTTELKVVTAGR